MMLCKLGVWEMHLIRGLLERIMGVGIGKNFAGKQHVCPVSRSEG